MSVPEDLLNLLNKCGQEHLVRFWDDLTVVQKCNLQRQLLDSDLPKAVTDFSRAMSSSNNNEKLSDDKIEPVPSNLIESHEKTDSDRLSAYEELGFQEISNSKVAVLLMAGGQGTRLGVDYPKGMFDVGLPSGRTLYHLQALRILRLENLARERCGKTGVITWYLMTSDATRDSTVEYFRSNNYFGLQKENLVFFEQGTIPCYDFEGKIILDEKHRIATAPNGNGGLYEALFQQGVIEDMAKRGINSIHAFSVDNILCRVADPMFVGFCLSRQTDFGLKVVTKRAADEPLGNICLVDGKYKVVEYSELSDEKANLRDPQSNELLFNSGNICNHYFTLRFLKELGKEIGDRMELHVAKKKIPYVDEKGIKQKPPTPNGIKIEKFVFDILKYAKSFAVWQVSRSKEFSALKNSDSARVDCPATARSDVLRLHKEWLLKAGAVSVEGDLEVCPLTSYGGEDLEKIAEGQKLKGPKCI